ncbi:MAG: hypothetical protein ACYCPQ_01070 [Elusimicrobiota bacterium]
MKTFLTRARLVPWLGAILIAVSICSCYPFMYAFRSAWQNHYPELAAQWADNGPFTILGWFGTELTFDELSYAARVKNASDHLWAYDPYIAENRSQEQWINDVATYSIMGAFTSLVGDINVAWILMRFLCCIAWFLLIYSIMIKSAEDEGISAFCAAFITGFSYLLTWNFVHALAWSGKALPSLLHDAWSILSYGRTEGVIRLPRPGLTYPFLFLATLWIADAAEDPGWTWPILSGLLGGILAYVRLDVWSAYLTAAYAFAAVLWFKNRRFPWKIACGVALSTVISLPFLYFNYPPNPEFLLRLAVPYQRHFDWHSLAYLFLFWLGLRHKKKPLDLFLACLMAGSFVMVNIEIVTGYSLQPFHWKFFANIYAFLIIASFIPERFKEKPRAWFSAAAVSALLAFLQGFGYAAIHFPFQGLPADYAAAFRWLNRGTGKDSVVLTLNPEINALIPVFTRDKVFLSSGNPVISTYPLLKNCERLAQGMRIFGVNEARFLKDTLWRNANDESRADYRAGFKRGEIEKSTLFVMMFGQTPEDAARPIVSEALTHPFNGAPDYLWFGDIERQYAAKNFPPADGPWVEAYRNSSVIIFRRR